MSHFAGGNTETMEENTAPTNTGSRRLVVKPAVFADATSVKKAKPELTKGEQDLIRTTRVKEEKEVIEQSKLLRLIFCGSMLTREEAEENEGATLFESLNSLMDVGEYENKSASTPSGLVKLKIGSYFWDPNYSFDGGQDDFAGFIKSDFLAELESKGHLQVPASHFMRPGLVDDPDPEVDGSDHEAGAVAKREFVVKDGKVMVSPPTSLTIKMPKDQVWRSLFLTKFTCFLLFAVVDHCR